VGTLVISCTIITLGFFVKLDTAMGGDRDSDDADGNANGNNINTVRVRLMLG
jgi:hypothetical protein